MKVLLIFSLMLLSGCYPDDSVPCACRKSVYVSSKRALSSVVIFPHSISCGAGFANVMPVANNVIELSCPDLSGQSCRTKILARYQDGLRDSIFIDSIVVVQEGSCKNYSYFYYSNPSGSYENDTLYFP